jgi:hypothetical protein
MRKKIKLKSKTYRKMTHLARMILISDTAMWVIPKIYIYFMNSKLTDRFFQILLSVKYLYNLTFTNVSYYRHKILR